MKVRTNYVSNSSSSSFIIKYKRGSCIDVEGVSFSILDLISLIGYNINGGKDTYIKFDNKKDYEDYVMVNPYLTEEERKGELSIIKSLTEQEELLCFELDYADRSLRKIFNILSKLNLFETMKEENE